MEHSESAFFLVFWVSAVPGKRYGHTTAIGYLSQGHLAYDSLLKRRGHILFEPCRRDLLAEVLAGLSLAGLGW